jgi:2-polyprenyl-3-methyl-5-hydroxy-6-metoxy-1,4-benzoquinol methylase
MASLGKFDVALMLAVLEHFSRPEEMMRKVKSLINAEAGSS